MSLSTFDIAARSLSLHGTQLQRLRSGAIALAVAGMIHTLSSGAGVRPAWLALVIWPAVTAVPAFLAALVTEAALARLWPVGKL